MADNSMVYQALLGKMNEEGKDFLREGMGVLLHAIMEEDVKRSTGLGLNERGEGRTNHRNGYREREFDTRLGTIPLRVPKTRCGSYFPAFLEPRRRSEKALFAVVQQAYVSGVSTRKIDDLVQAMGIEKMDKSQVSRICKQLDELVEAFRSRPLDKNYRYVWLDATYVKVRENHRVVNTAVVVAMAVNDEGAREILGFDVGPAESYAFWLEFLRSLVRRGLKGVKLVTSDCHEGLKQAIKAVFTDAGWQRCRVHFMRNVLGRVQRSHQPMVSAAVRMIFIQPSLELARAYLDEVAGRFEKTHPSVAALLWESNDEILAFYSFPADHWRKIYSTNPLERLNKEIKRRSDVVSIFPDRNSLIRLVGALLAEQDDEWSVATRYLSLRSMLPEVEGNNVTGPDQRGILAS